MSSQVSTLFYVRASPEVLAYPLSPKIILLIVSFHQPPPASSNTNSLPPSQYILQLLVMAIGQTHLPLPRDFPLSLHCWNNFPLPSCFGIALIRPTYVGVLWLPLVPLLLFRRRTTRAMRKCELSLDPKVATLFGREIGQSNGDILLTDCWNLQG